MKDVSILELNMFLYYKNPYHTKLDYNFMSPTSFSYHALPYFLN